MHPTHSGAATRTPARPPLVRAALSAPAVPHSDAGGLSLRAAAPVLFVASPGARQRLAALPRLDVACASAAPECAAPQRALAQARHAGALGSSGTDAGPRAAFSSPSPSPSPRSSAATPSATFSPLSSARVRPSSALSPAPALQAQHVGYALHGHAPSDAPHAGVKEALRDADDADDASQEPLDDGEPGWYRAAWRRECLRPGAAAHAPEEPMMPCWHVRRLEAALLLDA
jgi:hypothetical protein